MSSVSGSLVLVATPIGNLSDMSERAIETLKAADLIACEDTRHTRKLLNHFGITGAVTSVHEHNERQAAQGIVERIRGGETVALVTDAGMPAISDPGEFLVSVIAEAGLDVSVIPGPSAAIAALAISGLPTERVCFESFLPTKSSDRKKRIEEISNEARTSILYEAPHRLAKTAQELADACGEERRVVLVRELTKIHEEVWRGTLIELVTRADGIKGECVLVLEGAEVGVEISDEEITAALSEAISSGMSKKDAASFVSEQLSVPRNRVYKLAL